MFFLSRKKKRRSGGAFFCFSVIHIPKISGARAVFKIVRSDVVRLPDGTYPLAPLRVLRAVNLLGRRRFSDNALGFELPLAALIDLRNGASRFAFPPIDFFHSFFRKKSPPAFIVPPFFAQYVPKAIFKNSSISALSRRNFAPQPKVAYKVACVF